MALTNNYNNYNNYNIHHTSRHPANNTIYPRNDPRDVDSDDDYGDDDDYDSDEDDIYDPEEESTTRFNIVYCDLYKELLHGETNNEHLKKSFLVINRYKKLDLERNQSYLDKYNNKKAQILGVGSILMLYEFAHRHENLNPVLFNPTLDIAECFYLPDGEAVCVKKTFWLRLIQRKWKSIYKQRREIMNNSVDIPTLKGMLNNI
jgi:hypothetical protein